MAMTFDIPSDMQRDVAGIPGLDLRVALYLQHEVKLETLRRQRHSAAARAIAEHAVIQAQRDQKAGYDWDSSFDTLQQQHQAIISRL